MRLVRLGAVLPAVAVIAGTLLPTGAVAQQAEQRQLDQARERLAQLGDEIATAEREADDAETALSDADERLRAVEAVVNDVAAAVDRQRGAVREATAQLAQVEQEAAEVAALFADRAARMFKQGSNLTLEILLSSGGAEDAVARSSYLRSVVDADRVSMEALDAAEAAVDAERERLQVEQDRLEAMLAEQEELLEEVARIRESRALSAAEAREQVRLLGEEHDDLEAEQEALEQLIREKQAEERRRREAEQRAQREAEQRAQREAEQRAQREAEQRAQREAQERARSEQPSSSSGSSAPSSGPAPAPSSSGFAWPLCAPVTSEYGPRWGRLHAGIDLGAPTGTPIGASKAGTVIYAGWQGGYGQLVLVDHHDGVVTAYAHMSRFAVSGGASVSQGQTIGYVGSTGNSTGPHLHFETRVNGSAVNPRQYLSGSPC